MKRKLSNVSLEGMQQCRMWSDDVGGTRAEHQRLSCTDDIQWDHNLDYASAAL